MSRALSAFGCFTTRLGLAVATLACDLLEGRRRSRRRARTRTAQGASVPLAAPAVRKRGAFDVIGGRSGTRYRIHHGYQMNIEQLDWAGRRVRLLCFAPKGRLAIGDIMLAQKLALELYEEDAILAANKIAVSTMLQSPPRRGIPPRRPR